MLVSMSTLSVLRYRTFLTRMFDLGNMSQAIWSVTQGRPLELTGAFGTLSRMSWHVELIFFPIAALYALRPSPETLLILQALFYAAGAWPAYRLAQRRMGTRLAGFLSSIIYLFYPVGLTALLFEFHADTLVMPILLFAIEAFDRRAWRSYAFWIVLALSAKIYVAAPVLALGFVIWFLGERRAGNITMMAAVGWGMFAFFIVQPQFAASQVSALGPFVEGDYLTTHFGSVALLPTIGIRLASVVLVLLPVVMLGWRAWTWLLPAMVVIVPAALSSEVDTSSFFRHHYALTVPFLVSAVIFGAERFKDRPGNSRRNWAGDLIATVLITVLLSFVIVDSPINLRYLQSPLQQRLELGGFYISSRDQTRADWLAEYVPPDVPIMSSLLNTTHLTNRFEIYPTGETIQLVEVWGPQVEAAVIDGFAEYYLGGFMFSEQENIGYFLKDPDFNLIHQRDGMLLFTREDSGLQQNIDVIPAEEHLPLQKSFGDLIGLVSVELTQLSKERYSLTYVWTSLQPLSDLPDLFAVTRIEGVENSRYLHLPTWTVLTTTDWEEDTLIRETMEITLPDDIASGEHALLVGWYHSEDILAVYSDERTRLGEEVEIGSIRVP